MAIHALRLEGGTEVRSFLTDFTREFLPNGGYVLTCVGSVSKTHLRFATKENGEHEIKIIDGYREVLSLTGTLSRDGLHLHVSLSDDTGNVIGGHLYGEMIVQTTLEIVIGENPRECQFTRTMDEKTGFKELVIIRPSQ